MSPETLDTLIRSISEELTRLEASLTPAELALLRRYARRSCSKPGPR